ncbi:hypothetical protein ACPW7J_03470 [Ihubacter sp. rT4E-8]|uniref:hypothetical protein n=1 Tax=unclassified Ihubacter TaxID=2633299 RepID=UPI00137B2DB4
MAKKNYDLEPNAADKGRRNGTSAAAKAALAILGIGFVAGTTLVVGMDHIMKKIFVNEEWPDEEWSNDDWAEEDLEG